MTLGIISVHQKNSRTFHIHWNDNTASEIDVVELRRQCPCALCIDEITHKRILRPEDVSDEIRPIRVDSVGNYALTVRFNDQHTTGIYTYELLKKIGTEVRNEC